MPNSPVQEMFASPTSVDDNAIIPSIPADDREPTLGCAGWSDFILTKLNDDEWSEVKNGKGKVNKYPKTGGLRRVMVEHVADIEESISRVVAVPTTDNNFTAAVEHHLAVVFKQPYSIHRKGVFQGVGECNECNSDAPYNKYALALASTRALGRAIRDVLQVNTVVAEELSRAAEIDDDSQEPISTTQISAIKNICKRLSIDVNKFINSGAKQYEKIENINKETARTMLGYLSAFENKDKPIPDKIKLS